MRITIVFALAFVFSCQPTKKENNVAQEENNGVASASVSNSEEEMAWIPGGEFTMGTDDANSYSHERPAHRVKVDGFWMDETEVTNEDFREFVKATNYTTVAERKPEWEELKKQLPPGTEKPADEMLVAGSLVFNPPGEVVPLNDISRWWEWTPQADWRHPAGPESDIEEKDRHPVVHVAHEDAVAYCKWAGKRLPTEAEWEYASRGGKEGQRFYWGPELRNNGKFMANTFQGIFPAKNTGEDGFVATSPVKAFPPNDYGLYDMIGNVWEWTSDWYNVNYYSELAAQAVAVNPQGPETYYDPAEPHAPKHVTKGGSFLCADNYCVNYRSTARQGTTYDSGASHIGFRCVKSKNGQD